VNTPKIYIAGVGMTRFGKHLAVPVKELVREAVHNAIADAGCALSDVGAVYFGTAGQGAIEGQYMVAGQIALKAMGITGIPVVNVENACATSSTALNTAKMYLAAGEGDICLAVGVDKLFSQDKAASLRVFDGAWDVAQAEAQLQLLMALAPESEFVDAKPSRQTSAAFLWIFTQASRGCT